MIILYIVKENIFVNIVYKLLVQKKYQKDILKYAIKINAKQRIIMPQKGEYNLSEKNKSPFIIYAGFESILAQEDNQNQNPEEYYTIKYQNHITCSCRYK